MASMIWWYPVHRQRWPEIASLISSRLGREFLSNRDLEDINIPGVQKPHWIAPWSIKDFCNGWRDSRLPRPSTVSTFLPSTFGAKIKQALTGIPSNNAVQAPHSPIPQPSFVPVRPNFSRRSRSKVQWGGTSTWVSFPFSVNLISIEPCIQRF